MGKNIPKKIICCGETLFDLVAKKSSKGKPLTLHAYPGGSATNTSMILALLDLPVALMSRLGTDSLSQSLISILKDKGIDTRHIIKDKNINAPLALASIDSKGNSSYIFYGKEVPHKDKAQHLCETPFKSAVVFHASSFFSYSDVFFRSVMKRLRLAKKRNVFITYDPNWRESKIPNKAKARQRIKKILAYVDLVKLSEDDALHITQAKTLNKALEKIKKHLKGDIIVTLGTKGAFYWNGKKKITQPAFKVRIKDTIGAGDGFTAGLIYRYSADGKDAFLKNMKRNLEFASAVSALICSGHGAVQGLTGLRQVNDFLRSHATR
ncbi:MAG: carbohydrate kinase [Candidatus Omnitrophota bacterium]|jgi:fructokinase